MKLQAACLFLTMAVASAQNVTVEVGGKPVGVRGKRNWSRARSPPDLQRRRRRQQSDHVCAFPEFRSCFHTR